MYYVSTSLRQRICRTTSLRLLHAWCGFILLHITPFLSQWVVAYHNMWWKTQYLPYDVHWEAADINHQPFVNWYQVYPHVKKLFSPRPGLRLVEMDGLRFLCIQSLHHVCSTQNVRLYWFNRFHEMSKGSFSIAWFRWLQHKHKHHNCQTHTTTHTHSLVWPSLL